MTLASPAADHGNIASALNELSGFPQPVGNQLTISIGELNKSDFRLEAL